MTIRLPGVITMGFRILGMALLLISTASFAQGRGPAVEDFVGIEIEETEHVPQGTESLYNLEQDLTKYHSQESKPTKDAAPTISQGTPRNIDATTIFTVSVVMGLPLMIWFLMMAHLKKKASIENASNIEVLEKYRQAREKKTEEKIRKVS
jgi:hypothetical protein